MEEKHTATADDQSHYEISLTAGQAFVAFVLLLLSLAAAFAFGLMIGKGQADERLVVRKETPIVTEANLAPNPKKSAGEIVELPVESDEFQDAETDTAATTDTASTAPVIAEETTTAPATTTTEAPAPPTTVADAPKVPHFAQLLSTGDQKVAEAFAAKLIERGFTSAYVERGAATDKGPVFRVRVRFESEPEARAAEAKLREFSKDVWITSK